MFIQKPCLGYKTYEKNQVLAEREKEWLYVACEKKKLGRVWWYRIVDHTAAFRNDLFIQLEIS